MWVRVPPGSRRGKERGFCPTGLTGHSPAVTCPMCRHHRGHFGASQGRWDTSSQSPRTKSHRPWDQERNYFHPRLSWQRWAKPRRFSARSHEDTGSRTAPGRGMGPTRRQALISRQSGSFVKGNKRINLLARYCSSGYLGTASAKKLMFDDGSARRCYGRRGCRHSAGQRLGENLWK